MKTILLSLLILPQAFAQTVVGTDTTFAEINIKTKVEVKYVETYEACVFTYDPQWADEEDTREAETVYDNYWETTRSLEKIIKSGFNFYGYKGSDECRVENSTFPEVLTTDGERYFVQYVARKKMAELAKKQGAFKKVTRIYLKGLENFNMEAAAAVQTERKSLINSLK